MSEFLYHEACPDCGSKDNRAVFKDGHKWCFGCETFTPPLGQDILNNILSTTRKEDKNKKNDNPPLPIDFNYSLPQLGLDWLRQYGIDEREIAKHKIGWSYNFYRNHNKVDGATAHYGHMNVGLMVFPFYPEAGVCAGWQGRTFVANQLLRAKLKVPKYLTFTTPDFLPLYRNYSDTHSICLVEDVVSAIKVSRQMSCMPLLKASVSADRLVTLSKTWRRLVLWLDCDMMERSFDIEKQARPYFDVVEIVSTPRDPKCHSEADIVKKVLDI